MTRCATDQTRRGRIFSIITDTSGAALIEFAMVVPVLITLYLGGFQLMDAVSVYRKVTTTTRSIADLSTQNTLVTDDSLQTILDASAQIMAPYKPTNGFYRVSLINVASDGTSTVLWSKSKDGTEQLTPGSPYSLPANIKQADLDLVVCDVTYTYKPIAFFGLLGNIPFSDRIYMLPRKSPTITKQ